MCLPALMCMKVTLSLTTEDMLVSHVSAYILNPKS